jgi:hypothetical protein
MKWILLIFAIGGTLNASAQNRRFRTVSECAADLSREVFMSTQAKKAEKYCREYSQRTIDCATQLAQTKKLTYNFESALKDCHRLRDSQSEY